MPSVMNQANREIVSLSTSGSPDILLIGKYHYAGAQPGLIEHRHPGIIEFCFMARGEQVYHVRHQYYRIRTGDLFFTWPDEAHGTGTHPEEKGTLYWLQIRIPSPGRGFLGLKVTQGKLLLGALRAIRRRHFLAPPQTQWMFDEIMEAGKNRGRLAALKIEALVLQFLVRTCESASNSTPSRKSGPVCQALNFANQNPLLHVDDLARASGLSLSHFKTKFRRETGLPPAEYLLRCRLDRAARLLRETSKSITEITFDLDFGSSQYFATVFQKYHGQTPSAYRTNKPISMETKDKVRPMKACGKADCGC